MQAEGSECTRAKAKTRIQNVSVNEQLVTPVLPFSSPVLSSYFDTINKGKSWDSSGSCSIFMALSNCPQLPWAVFIYLGKFSSLYGRLLNLTTVADTSTPTQHKENLSCLFAPKLAPVSWPALRFSTYFCSHLILLSFPPTSFHSCRFCSQDASESLPFLPSLLLPPYDKTLLLVQLQ